MSEPGTVIEVLNPMCEDIGRAVAACRLNDLAGPR